MGVGKREGSNLIWTERSLVVKMTKIMNNRERNLKEEYITHMLSAVFLWELWYAVENCIIQF